MRITLSGPYNHSTRRFWFISLLPTLDFVIDRQMEERIVTKEEIFGGTREYSLGIGWLVFMFYINLEVNV